MEVVFSVEATDGLDGAVEGDGGADRGDQRGLLEERLRARDGEVEGGDERVRSRGTGVVFGGGEGRWRKELAVRVELRVYLDADCELPARNGLVIGTAPLLLPFCLGLGCFGLVL